MPIIKPVKDGRFFIKWLHASYFQDVAELECFSGERLWSRNNIKRMIDHERTGGYIVTDLKKPVGYIVFEEDPDHGTIWILNIVVHPDYRHMGLGTLLLKRVEALLKKHDSMELKAFVRDSNLGAHLFLRKNDFVCAGVHRSFFRDRHGEKTEYGDGYLFCRENKTEPSYCNGRKDRLKC